MTELLKTLCQLNAPSGREEAVRQYLLDAIGDKAETRMDALGNLIVFKKGKRRPKVQVMLDAHMDEVGVIVTHITGEGYLKFATVGGVDVSVLAGRRVRFLNGVVGVIGVKPIHLLTGEEAKQLPKLDTLYIDIGAASREEAMARIWVGEEGVFDTPFLPMADGQIAAKAIDDRAGVAVLLQLLGSELEYDMTFTFTVQEETGLSGAAVAAFDVAPEAAIVVESTTAADFDGNPEEKWVCRLGEGAVLSFMDGRTLYDHDYYAAALETAGEQGIPCQSKLAVAGGNNAGAIHAARAGVRTLAVSMPCRYLHSGFCVANLQDVGSVARLVEAMANRIAGGAL